MIENNKNQYVLKIPRFLKVTNRVEDNDLDIVKVKLRKNRICHMDFNPSFENAEGQRYFGDVYIQNQPEEVYPVANLSDINPATYPSKNLYEHIIERGFDDYIGKGHGVTSLRTGYDPAEQKLKFKMLKI